MGGEGEVPLIPEIPRSHNVCNIAILFLFARQIVIVNPCRGEAGLALTCDRLSSRHGVSRDPEVLILPFICVYLCSSVRQLKLFAVFFAFIPPAMARGHLFRVATGECEPRFRARGRGAPGRQRGWFLHRGRCSGRIIRTGRRHIS